MFRGEDPTVYKDGMNKMWRMREKLRFLRSVGALSSQQESRARYAEDLLWHAMMGKGKRYDERDR